MSQYEDKFQRLAELGAGDFAHLNGSLEEHFIGVYDLLVDWNAAPALQDAGLFHAAYGTSGFTDQMVSLDQRDMIADIISEAAEAIVYLYCSCDRDVFWPRIGVETPLLFKDRFSDMEFELSPQQLPEFCELTAANELQLAAADPAFADQYRTEFIDVFGRMAPWLTPQATAYAQSVLEPALSGCVASEPNDPAAAQFSRLKRFPEDDFVVSDRPEAADPRYLSVVLRTEWEFQVQYVCFASMSKSAFGVAVLSRVMPIVPTIHCVLRSICW